MSEETDTETEVDDTQTTPQEGQTVEGTEEETEVETWVPPIPYECDLEGWPHANTPRYFATKQGLTYSVSCNGPWNTYSVLTLPSGVKVPVSVGGIGGTPWGDVWQTDKFTALSNQACLSLDEKYGFRVTEIF